jgi:hypothetical protein
MLSWTAVAGASSYLVIVRIEPSGPVLATFPVTGLHVTAPDVPAGTYFVTIAGRREGLVGSESNLVRVDVG